MSAPPPPPTHKASSRFYHSEFTVALPGFTLSRQPLPLTADVMKPWNPREERRCLIKYDAPVSHRAPLTSCCSPSDAPLSCYQCIQSTAEGSCMHLPRCFCYSAAAEMSNQHVCLFRLSWSSPRFMNTRRCSSRIKLLMRTIDLSLKSNRPWWSLSFMHTVNSHPSWESSSNIYSANKSPCCYKSEEHRVILSQRLISQLRGLEVVFLVLLNNLYRQVVWYFVFQDCIDF